jgi:Zn-finger nucleic acid-binding protein
MDPYRDAHRNCPCCNGELRTFQDRQVCDACEGLMLSIDDLSGAIAELTGLPPTLSYRDEAPGKRPCPHCSAPMTTTKLTIEIEGSRPAKPDAEVDRCVAHGLWFDKDELASVLAPIAGKGFGGGAAHPASLRDKGTTMQPRSVNFKIGGRGWGM